MRQKGLYHKLYTLKNLELGVGSDKDVENLTKKQITS